MRANITFAVVVATLGAAWLYVMRDDLGAALVAVAFGTAPGVLMACVVIGASELNTRWRWRREYSRQLERDRWEHCACNASIRPLLRPGTPDIPWQPDTAAISRRVAQMMREE